MHFQIKMEAYLLFCQLKNGRGLFLFNSKHLHCVKDYCRHKNAKRFCIWGKKMRIIRLNHMQLLSSR